MALIEKMADKAARFSKANIGRLLNFPFLPSGSPTNARHPATKSYVDTIVTNYIYNLLKRQRRSAPPVFSSTTQYTKAFLNTISVDEVTWISKTGSTTVDVTTTGLNGILQSANLGGTCGTGGVPSTTITGSGTSFNTDFVVGDVIWTSGAARRITNIGGATTMTVESSVTISNGTSYRRGGRAPNTIYYEYEATDNTTPGCYLSTRCVSSGQSLVDVPTGYSTYYRQSQGFVILNASSNIINFEFSVWENQGATWTNATSLSATEANIDMYLISAGNQTSFTTITSSKLIPKTAVALRLYHEKLTSAGIFYRKTGSGATDGIYFNEVDNQVQHNIRVPLDSSQSFDYKVSGGSIETSINAIEVRVNS